MFLLTKVGEFAAWLCGTGVACASVVGIVISMVISSVVVGLALVAMIFFDVD